MKKLLVLAVMSLSIFGVFKIHATAALYPEIIFTKNLRYGICDTDVHMLQKYLLTHNYLPLGTSLTGYFGPLTLMGVKKLQTYNGIKNTGFVGPVTRAFLNGENAKQKPTPSIGYGTGLILTPKCIYDKFPVADLP